MVGNRLRVSGLRRLRPRLRFRAVLNLSLSLSLNLMFILYF